MKINYASPIVLVKLFNLKDVICTSARYGSDGSDDYGYDFWD